MAVMPEVQKQLLASSDYRRDLVVWAESGSVIIEDWGVGAVRFAHGLPFAPLVQVVFSRTADFAVAYPNGYRESTGQMNSLQLYSWSTVEAVFLQIYADPGERWYYRTFGLMPAGASGAVAPTAGVASKFLYSSDNRYTKLYMNGRADTSSETPARIVHNLGYVPQAEVWGINIFGEISSDTSWGVLDGSLNSDYLTDTELVLGSVGRAQVEYRIYLDEY